ncbi:hypothetical protein BT96DRAFT_32476 [Gymnopus androsaceus JB14]|uniref:Uncharacterized protein n=1 Tax=Gymnopus androsaceus JB14 TaxID=1447944 RepID=A0A6A4HN40_9AGAR|nr:hypothetical protein BT96DRAFT_32476 [Gymnopus androsaceus JB14]
MFSSSSRFSSHHDVRFLVQVLAYTCIPSEIDSSSCYFISLYTFLLYIVYFFFLGISSILSSAVSFSFNPAIPDIIANPPQHCFPSNLFISFFVFQTSLRRRRFSPERILQKEHGPLLYFRFIVFVH